MRLFDFSLIDGEGRNPTQEHILSAAKKAGFDPRKARGIMEEVKTAVLPIRL